MSKNQSSYATETLLRILEHANLSNYYDNFVLLGGDDVKQLCEADEDEFLEIMSLVGMSTKPLHVRRLQKSLQLYCLNPDIFLPTLESPHSINRSKGLNSLTNQNNLSNSHVFSPNFDTFNHFSESMHDFANNSHKYDYLLQSSAIKTIFDEMGINLSSKISCGDNTSITVKAEPPDELRTKYQPFEDCLTLKPNSNSKPQVISSPPKHALTNAEKAKIKLSADKIVATITDLTPKSLHNKKTVNKEIEDLINCQERNEVWEAKIRSFATIYGRFDSKKREKPMSLHEHYVNEAAIELCTRKPELLRRRDELFPLARQVVRQSGYQYTKKPKLSHPSTPNVKGSVQNNQSLNSSSSLENDQTHMNSSSNNNHRNVIKELPRPTMDNELSPTKSDGTTTFNRIKQEFSNLVTDLRTFHNASLDGKPSPVGINKYPSIILNQNFHNDLKGHDNREGNAHHNRMLSMNHHAANQIHLNRRFSDGVNMSGDPTDLVGLNKYMGLPDYNLIAAAQSQTSLQQSAIYNELLHNSSNNASGVNSPALRYPPTNASATHLMRSSYLDGTSPPPIQHSQIISSIYNNINSHIHNSNNSRIDGPQPTAYSNSATPILNHHNNPNLLMNASNVANNHNLNTTLNALNTNHNNTNNNPLFFAKNAIGSSHHAALIDRQKLLQQHSQSLSNQHHHHKSDPANEETNHHLSNNSDSQHTINSVHSSPLGLAHSLGLNNMDHQRSPGGPHFLQQQQQPLASTATYVNASKQQLHALSSGLGSGNSALFSGPVGSTLPLPPFLNNYFNNATANLNQTLNQMNQQNNQNCGGNSLGPHHNNNLVMNNHQLHTSNYVATPTHSPQARNMGIMDTSSAINAVNSNHSGDNSPQKDASALTAQDR